MKISNKTYGGIRPLFQSRNLDCVDCVFTHGDAPMDGESPLKEGKNLSLSRCTFGWKYPLWYCENVTAEDCTFETGARAGIWYTKNMLLRRAKIASPKMFRRAENITLEDVEFSDAAETFWGCRDVKLSRVTAKGDYFGMNMEGGEISDFTLLGNYCFDGASNLTLRRVMLDTKDAFWNCKNIRVEDSVIRGEYLGWNSQNLTFINCTIESLQGLCYIQNLVMRGCRVKGELLFEYSTLDAEAEGRLESVFDPAGGRIAADSFGSVEFQVSDPAKTQIICRK